LKEGDERYDGDELNDGVRNAPDGEGGARYVEGAR
jgi:hypothetical protein